MGWRLRLPRGGGLRLHGGSSVRLGTFFPLLAWEPSVGWATDPPSMRSPAETWTSPAADFDVHIKRPRGLNVLATGEALGGGHWRARAVRDFAVAVGRFRITRATVAVPQPIRVTIGAEKGSHARPQSFLPQIRQALQSYGTRFGPYPWGTYNAAVMTDFTIGGYEYPTLVFLGSASEHQAAHETAHQWFYSLVGNDQARDPGSTRRSRPGRKPPSNPRTRSPSSRAKRFRTGAVVVVEALTTAVPLAETAYHLAPNARTPSPFVWPALLSSVYL
jgi:hypothetical protein